ncbi:hypothetical protein EDC01DRAFT_360725 [Geopyxis carbonaria]|nr:hypothetical protein EDC01DRAFT_360725 [Geopyxis carbonaria]
MVFKPFTTLARQSISKHLVSGYAQSVVAASQSSYASSTLPIHKLGSNAPAKIQNAFNGTHSGRTAPGRDSQGSESLTSFLAAQSQGLDDKDEKKYLFSRKILWSKAQHQQQQKQLLGQPQPISENQTRSRRGSNASLIEEIDEAAEAIDSQEALSESVAREAVEEAKEVTQELAQDDKQSSTEGTLVNSVPETPAITTQYNRQLQSLRDEGRYQEVAAVFRHMVAEGVPLNTTSYNLLLTSIVKLGPRYVPEVLDVYKLMLREKIIPNTTTYTVLIDFLASRAIRSHSIIRSVEKDAERFGVMLPSKNSVADELQREDTLNLALQLFYASTEVRKERAFPAIVYDTLIKACSKHGRDDDMLNVYTHMEGHNIAPTPEIIRSLIRGFGKNGNVRSAVETYNCWQDMDVAHDPAMMDERYQIYKDLIKAYMDGGDSVGAIAFMEKVVDISREPSRLEWLTQAVIKGLVQEGDTKAAIKWASQLSLRPTHTKWLAKIMSQVADKGELGFARVLYNSLNTNQLTDAVNVRYAMADCQRSGLALCIREGNVDLARALWNDLNDRDASAGPNVATAVAYTSLLFRSGLVNEALVVLDQYSAFLMDRYVPNPKENLDSHFQIEARRADLQEAYEYTIISLDAQGLLTPSIALDIAGFSVSRCGGLGGEAAKRILGQFDSARIMGLEPSQLSLLLQLQVSIMDTRQNLELAPLVENLHTFDVMLTNAMAAGFPVVGQIGELMAHGVALASQMSPELAAKWERYVQQQLYPVRQPSPAPVTPISVQTSPIDRDASPNILSSETSVSVDENYDPYWSKTDVRTSNAIDTSLERNKYNKIADLRRMYRNSRRTGKAIRLTTLSKIITATARTGAYEDFIEEIYRNAKVDMPFNAEYPTSKFGWCVLLDSLVAAQLNLGRREKAGVYHNEMLKMGASPSANTFGLYIVSLKGSKTYDEASEAVSIFDRARAENVLPSSFLYNALIGKLAKARRVDDCLFYFAEMRALGIKPTSVTYGTMINALTRVGDETFAEELFQEMETMTNYKPRPAPYNSLMQFFITTKRDRSKVLAYYNRMLSLGIAPTSHTYKLLIEAYATLEKPDMKSAEKVLDAIAASGETIETAHHAALIHAKGCVLHDVPSAIAHFEAVLAAGTIYPDSTLYQALLECLVANHRVSETTHWVDDMAAKGISLTPYIANTLIHGWALEKNIKKAREVYEALGNGHNGNVRREPSTYEAMTRAYLAVEDREGAKKVADEMLRRGYPNAVVARVLDLVRGVDAAAPTSS